MIVLMVAVMAYAVEVTAAGRHAPGSRLPAAKVGTNEAPGRLGVSGSGLLASIPPPLAEASPAPRSPEKDKDKKKPDQPVYATFLKNPASLGFKPDQKLLDVVYLQVKHQHINEDPDARLYAGVAREVEKLLKEAGLPVNGISSLPKDRSLPERIAKALAGKIDPGVLYYAMVRGMLEGTDDPYTVLMTPDEMHRLMVDLQNEAFGGIGIFIELDRESKDQLTVVEPLEGTPAYAAGLLPGDQILKINGKPTTGMSLDIATSNIRGPEGSQVILTIRRTGTTPDTKDYTITRAKIETASVTQKMLPSKVGLIRLRMFGRRTGSELADAIRKLEAEGARALILDVRNNGGGYINAAVSVLGLFVPRATLVTFLTDREKTRKDYHTVEGPQTRLPLVLLVNAYSASASEITAGCLKDSGRAVLIGMKTFGKGSVQQMYPLPDGAALKITIAHFFTPKGAKINKVGVEPDIKAEMEPRYVGRGDKDIQVKRAVEYFRSKGIVQ